MRKFLKILCIILAAVLLIVGGYFAYVFISFYRIGDKPLEVAAAAEKEMETGREYTILSYNIGFGAYESDFGFFMDGGDRAWAWSKERLDENLSKIASFLKEKAADLYLIQEVDIGSTRSYHRDERPVLTEALKGYSSVFAQNYDSPFLFYPITQPHGKSRSGIMTFSSFRTSDANRYELPIETGITKVLDLDRCYMKQKVAVEGGKTLVLYNFHFSAYTSDGTIANEQLKLVLDDMEKEAGEGNYCIAGGDFNKDLLGDSSVYFGKADKEYTWAQPIPKEVMEGRPVRLVAPLDESKPVPSCRNADSAYHEGQLVLTIDGFLVSENVEVKKSDVIDTGFAYSDHNPVYMTFVLN